MTPKPACTPAAAAAGLKVGDANDLEVAKVADAQFAILRAAFVCDLTRRARRRQADRRHPWLSIAPTFGMSELKSFPTAHTGPIPGLFR